MIGNDVISMPDKWEYPWFAAWDLAFHTLALATVDIDFAKQQLDLLLRQLYRPDKFRPMSGTSATSTLQYRAGQRSFSTAWSRRCAANPISIF
jgi:hypothetical protein